MDRESYSLAAGLSLGMITLGCGNDLPGMTDLDLVDQLYHYINGGIKKVCLCIFVTCIYYNFISCVLVNMHLATYIFSYIYMQLCTTFSK